VASFLWMVGISVGGFIKPVQRNNDSKTFFVCTTKLPKLWFQALDITICLQQSMKLYWPLFHFFLYHVYVSMQILWLRLI